MEELRSETQTTILVDVESQAQIETQTPEEKREKARAKLFNFVVQEPEKKVLPKQSISLERQVFENDSSQPDNQIIPDEYFEDEIKNKDNLIDDIEEAESQDVVQQIEVNNDSDIEEETKTKKRVVYERKPKKNLILRLKLAVCAVVCVLTCLGGWAIYNAVEIKTLTGEAQAKNAEYNINVVTVISNTSKLDDLTNTNSITNLDELERANIIEVIPKEKVAPKVIEKQSNWFDRVCNWLSNLFK